MRWALALTTDRWATQYPLSTAQGQAWAQCAVIGVQTLRIARDTATALGHADDAAVYEAAYKQLQVRTLKVIHIQPQKVLINIFIDQKI